MSAIKFQFEAWEKYFEVYSDEKLNEKESSGQDSGESKSKTFCVTCLLCKPKPKALCVSKKSSWNLKNHIESTHTELKSEVPESVKNFKTNPNVKKRKDTDDIPHTNYKQLKLSDFSGKSKVLQSGVDELIVDAVCDAILPHSFVENKSVRKLLATAFPGRNIMHRKCLVRNIEDNFTAMQNEMKVEFLKVVHVCLTADSWTSYRRAFIGLTAHWICDTSFKRKSCALARKRIIGKQTGEVFATKIDEIINFYGLHGKVVRIVTVSGKNYIKAFRLVDEWNDDHKGKDDDDDSDIEPFEITDQLSDYQNTTNNLLLPSHERCSAHTLNLVMSKDMPKAVPDNSSTFFKRLHGDTISKCYNLFNKQNRSSKMADIVKMTIGRYLLTPVAVRWNSEHNSLKLLSKLFISKPTEMSTVFEALQQPKLSNEELSFLHEYVKVVDVVANALNVMQGEDFMYTGLYTPTSLHLLSKLDALSELKYCNCLRGILKDAINKRFPSIMDDKKIKATILHPFFRNFKFLQNERANRRLRNKMISELVEELELSTPYRNLFSEQELLRNKGTCMDTFKVLKKFFKEEDDTSDNEGQINQIPSADEVLRNYLYCREENLERLAKFPLISPLFIQYNTSLLSSGASERLFSTGKNVLKLNRCSKSNEHFENQLLLKVNKY